MNDEFGGEVTDVFQLKVTSGKESGLTDGEVAAIALSITGSFFGILYTVYKFYKKRKFYKEEGGGKGKTTPPSANMVVL